MDIIIKGPDGVYHKYTDCMVDLSGHGFNIDIKGKTELDYGGVRIYGTEVEITQVEILNLEAPKDIFNKRRRV